MKEISYSWSSSIALAWAIAWRVIIMNVAVGIILHFALPQSTQLLALCSFLASIVSLVVSVHWVRARGFGSVKIVLVEWADYQQAVKQDETHGI